MPEFAAHTRFDLDRSPESLFFRVRASTDLRETTSSLAERIWNTARQQAIYHMVVELDGGLFLSSELVGQILRIHKRAYQNGGILRLCGLSDTNYQVLQIAMLGDRLFNFRDREAAVMGYKN